MSQIDVPTREAPRGSKMVGTFVATNLKHSVSFTENPQGEISVTKTFAQLVIGARYNAFRTAEGDYVLCRRPLNGIRRFMALLRV